MFDKTEVIHLFGITIQAWKQGNEKRDVVLLSLITGISGIGTLTFLAS